jgi:cob(I)alamin adenosyltransferase
MKIYTRRGDAGQTSLIGGARVSKNHTRVQAFGEVDELNASIGVALALLDAGDLFDLLREIQSSLFDLGSELATVAGSSKGAALRATDVERLERAIDGLDAELEPLTNFILPGGAPAAAELHLARTICRRAERRALALSEQEEVSTLALAYLNRLSDLLFTMARAVNQRAGVAEPLWVGRER